MLGEYRKFLAATGVESADAEALIATPMRAVRDAPAAEGSFPLVLLAPGNAQSAEDMAALAEFLAAHGFLVASVPSPTRISGPMESEADIPEKADEQATDLGFARRALGVQAREGRVGVAGHSFGARAAVLLAMRDADVAAVVSLDGGIGSKTGAGLLEKARGFARERMRAPLLHVYEELDPQMAPDFALIRSLDRSERWLVRAGALHHIHFTTIGALVAFSPGLFKATAATAETEPAWDALLETTGSFFAAFVAEAPDAQTSWAPPESRELRVERLPASR
jgi:dienelactone hydrolase